MKKKKLRDRRKLTENEKDGIEQRSDGKCQDSQDCYVCLYRLYFGDLGKRQVIMSHPILGLIFASNKPDK